MDFGPSGAQRRHKQVQQSKMKGCPCCSFDTITSANPLEAHELTTHGTYWPSGTVDSDWVGPTTVKLHAVPHQSKPDLQERSAPYVNDYSQHRSQSSLTEFRRPLQTSCVRIPPSSSSCNRAPTEVFKLAFGNNRVMYPYLYETYKYSLNDMANRKVETLTRGLTPVMALSDQARPAGSYAPVRIRYHS